MCREQVSRQTVCSPCSPACSAIAQRVERALCQQAGSEVGWHECHHGMLTAESAALPGASLRAAWSVSPNRGAEGAHALPAKQARE